jgi:drug/metabolite transporter (DMT)-like permease
LVVLSALAHGYWNFLFKQADDKDAFLGLTKLAEPVLWLAPFVVAVWIWGLDREAWKYVAVGALLSVANYQLLVAAYKRLDLAVAYPVARSSTIFLPFLAYLAFGEVIDAAGWGSVVLVSLGVGVVQLRPRLARAVSPHASASERWGLFYAVGAAFTVALYTLWGRVAVEHMHPFLYMYCYTLATALFFHPRLARLDRAAVRREWRANRWRILAVSFLNTFSYVLMLVALSMSKVTYVGALRQLSLAFGATLGWLVLRERLTAARLAGVALIIVGACLTYFAR